jgi:ubiquinone biosynthesis protein UbiJ
MPATPAWLATAEALLNRSIGASGQAAALAHRLEGTALQVNVEGIARMRAAIFRGRLGLFAGDDSAGADATAASAGPAGAGAAGAGAAGAGAGDDAADATISGSLPALLQLFKGGANRETGRPGSAKAEIRGDAEIANLYRELFIVARPDLEEELSRWIGDFPARRLSQFAERALGFARHARRTVGENVAEYLQEEGRDLVNKTELDEFLHGVDELRETADRIDVRLGRLEQRLKGHP